MSVSELASHAHTTLGSGSGSGPYVGPTYPAGHDAASTDSTGGGGPHNNMSPYEIDNVLVRVA